MRYEDDTCTWDDMLNQFSIERHALRLQIPQQADGNIACTNAQGEQMYPRLDYSKGFPNWWYLDHTTISVPSQHTQEGHQYDAEITLNHFYMIPHPKNQVSLSFCLLSIDGSTVIRN